MQCLKRNSVSGTHPDLSLQSKSRDKESSFVLMGFSLVLQYPVPPISYAKLPWHRAKSIISLIDCKSQIQVLPHYSLKSTIHFPDAA